MTGLVRRSELLVIIVGVLFLAGCQAGMGSSGSSGTLPGASAPGGLVMSPAPRSATGTAPASTEGLKAYKVYNTTEQLCERTCASEAQCVNHSFSPLSTINGYIAGQCQLYSRS